MNQLFENKKSSLEKSNQSSKKSLNSASYAFDGLYQLQELANQKSESTSQLKADASSPVKKLNSLFEMASNKSDSNFQNLNSVAQLYPFRKKTKKIHINLDGYDELSPVDQISASPDKVDIDDDLSTPISTASPEAKTRSDGTRFREEIYKNAEKTVKGKTRIEGRENPEGLNNALSGVATSTEEFLGDGDKIGWLQQVKMIDPSASDSAAGASSASDSAAGESPFDIIGDEIERLAREFGEGVVGTFDNAFDALRDYANNVSNTSFTSSDNNDSLVVDTDDGLSRALTFLQSSEKVLKILQPIAQFVDDCRKGKLSKTVAKDVFYKALRTLEGVSKAVEAGAELADTSGNLSEMFGGAGKQGVVESGESTNEVADVSGSLGSFFTGVRGIMSIYEEFRKLSEEEDAELDPGRKREIRLKITELLAKVAADGADLTVKVVKSIKSISDTDTVPSEFIPIIGAATGIFRGGIDLLSNIPKASEYHKQHEKISQQINDLNERWVQTGGETKGMQFGKSEKYTLENYKEIRRINIANEANIAKVEKEHALTNRVNLDPNLSTKALQEEILRKKAEAEENKTWKKKSFFSSRSKAKDIKRDLSGDEGRKAELAEALQKKKDTATKKLSDKQKQFLDQNGNFVMKSPEDPHGITTLTEEYDGETKKEIHPESDQHSNFVPKTVPLSQEQEKILRDYEIYSELKRVNKLKLSATYINFIESGSKILGNILTIIPEPTSQGVGAGLKAAGVVTKLGYQAVSASLDSSRDAAVQTGAAGSIARALGADRSKSSTAREAWRKEQVQNTVNKTHELGEKINLQDEDARKLLSELIEKNKKRKQLANLPETNLNIDEFNETKFFDLETAGEINNYAALMNIYKIKESELKDIDQVGFYAKIIKGLSVK